MVWNHGSDGPAKGQDMSRVGLHFGTYYALSRGYAVAHPLLRGYGGSGGDMRMRGCNLAGLGRSNARDIAAVIDRLAHEPDINAQRTIVAGTSFGGWNALAHGTLRDPHVVGLINFYGGARTPACPDGDKVLESDAKRFGKETRIRSLWLYGDNDSRFSTSTWQAMYAAYKAQGAPAELAAFGPFLSDSHQLLSYPRGLSLIAPVLDKFLASLDLPTQILHPQYLPLPPPARTDFAAIDDIRAAPLPNGQNRTPYRDFLARPYPRVIVIAPRRVVVVGNGGFDPLAKALADCRRHSDDCRPYAVDNDVVWTEPKGDQNQKTAHP
jgi:pimeloyl-ACP methyl ester carboxylesterase